MFDKTHAYIYIYMNVCMYILMYIYTHEYIYILMQQY